ncbi:unnamed protein product [Didymodactylos carnosus]|uniref:Methyltransferase domain-containing protein n=1 Tax=Didymodactylos carnosus TaxID=1234261 RepID=A0A815ERG2_9BILA|nr:unnamed protein product [Didymodactylos carnosus]CAF1391399.1 unnamed protein product [Didymodactylos carnosus]CAF4156071.1 unnamed protein product [Didymodactylos carnosus]CAF4199017.1 unnamed protein product [Didymodactylos carnosus]
MLEQYNDPSVVSNYFQNKRSSLDILEFQQCVIRRAIEKFHPNLPIVRALDVGCGEGSLGKYLLNEDIVASMVGVDSSQKMTELADRMKNDDNRLQYHNENVLNLSKLLTPDEKFPLVVSVNMLNHADNIEMLYLMVKNIFNQCSGYFIGIIPNPFFDFQENDENKSVKYGHKKIGKKHPLKDGDDIYVILGYGTDHAVQLKDHWYSASTYESVFIKAGFESFKWLQFEKLASDEEKQHFSDLFTNPPHIAFSAVI